MRKFILILFLQIVLSTSVEITADFLEDPPSPNKEAEMARYIVHECDWTSLATISSRNDTLSYPYVSLKSMSDGPVDNSTGVPYLYLTLMDVSGKDLSADNRCTMMATLAQSDYCKRKDLDPQDPRCAKVIITGKIAKLVNGTEEYKFALDSLFSRHPAMKFWPTGHEFFPAKIEILRIALLDFFGGMKNISIEDYFKVKIASFFEVDIISVDINVP